mmetsp:Transcript_57188/g.185849  ORF Transcript_57188/g.185849 Transcript_57188/m.185849 type:complete len:265 (-) Transcript_57188:832-1626(-)
MTTSSLQLILAVAVVPCQGRLQMQVWGVLPPLARSRVLQAQLLTQARLNEQTRVVHGEGVTPLLPHSDLCRAHQRPATRGPRSSCGRQAANPPARAQVRAQSELRAHWPWGPIRRGRLATRSTPASPTSKWPTPRGSRHRPRVPTADPPLGRAPVRSGPHRSCLGRRAAARQMVQRSRRPPRSRPRRPGADPAPGPPPGRARPGPGSPRAPSRRLEVKRHLTRRPKRRLLRERLDDIMTTCRICSRMSCESSIRRHLKNGWVMF